MADVTVDTDGTSGDYSSLSGAIAGESSTASPLNITCQASTGAADTTIVNVAGMTAAVVNITQASGDAHNGIWDTGSYRLETSATAHCLQISDTGVTVLGLQLRRTNTTQDNQAVCYINAANVEVGRCLVRGNNNFGWYDFGVLVGGTNGPCFVHTTICYDMGGNQTKSFRSNTSTGSGTTFFYNCAAHSAFSIQRSDGDMYVKNTWCQDTAISQVCFTGTFHANSDYNCSDDATAPGGNSQTSAEITHVNEGSDNFLLDSSDTVAKANGTDLSGDSDLAAAFSMFTVDIKGTTIGSTWDIGPHQISSEAVGGITINIGDATMAQLIGKDYNVSAANEILEAVGTMQSLVGKAYNIIKATVITPIIATYQQYVGRDYTVAGPIVVLFNSMMDAILGTTGGPTINDGLLAFYLANGATSANLADAEREFLVARGVSTSHRADMWYEFLTGLGSMSLTGNVNDMKLDWWSNGAPLT